MTSKTPDNYADYPFRDMEARGLILTGSLPPERARDGRFAPVVSRTDPGRSETRNPYERE